MTATTDAAAPARRTEVRDQDEKRAEMGRTESLDAPLGITPSA